MMSSARPLGESVSLPDRKGRALTGALLLLAILAGVVSGSRWPVDPRRFAFSYLTAAIFVISLAVGALAWLMLHHLTGAVWSVTLRRLMEDLTRPLLWIGLFFIPIAFSLSLLYPWADPTRVAHEAALAHRTSWLNPAFFIARSVFYFGCWAFLAATLARASMRHDRTSDPSLIERMRSTSALGLVVLALTTSFAAFDWLMSLESQWSSTMFGVYFWSGSLVGSLAALILLVLALRGAGYLRKTITIEHLHDLGKLLFSFVVFWAYIAFCQYFLIWYANIPEETTWYISRRSPHWNALSWSLFFGHFLVPFVLLLFRANRRSPFWLGFVALWVLAFHYVDMYWLVMPALNGRGVTFQWLDVAVLISLLSISGAIVARACASRPLVPIGDPRLKESLAFSNP
jgi:hypothetical protein